MLGMRLGMAYTLAQNASESKQGAELERVAERLAMSYSGVRGHKERCSGKMNADPCLSLPPDITPNRITAFAQRAAKSSSHS